MGLPTILMSVAQRAWGDVGLVPAGGSRCSLGLGVGDGARGGACQSLLVSRDCHSLFVWLTSDLTARPSGLRVRPSRSALLRTGTGVLYEYVIVIREG